MAKKQDDMLPSKKKAPQDATMRNVRSANRRLEELEDSIIALTRRINALEEQWLGRFGDYR